MPTEPGNTGTEQQLDVPARQQVAVPVTPPAAEARQRPPGIDTAMGVAPKRQRADDNEVRMLAERNDPQAAWQQAQAEGHAGPGATMTLKELTAEIQKLHFIRQQEAERLIEMWKTGNHNAQLLAVIQAELLGVSQVMGSLTTEVPRALNLIDENDGWMKRECKEMGIRIQNSYGDIETKLKEADGVQKDANASLEKLKQDMTYLKTDLETLGTRATPSTVSGPPVLAPGLISTLQREVNDARGEANARVNELKDMLVAYDVANSAQEVTVRQAEAKIAEIQHKLGQYEVHVAEGLSKLEQRAGCPCLTGECPCPCRKGACGEAKPRDAWSTYLKGKGDPNDGDSDDSGDGHGGGGPSGPAFYSVGTPRLRSEQKPLITLYSKPFDSKEKGELPHYDGKTGGVMWRRKVTNFLITRVPDLEAILRWTESTKDVITLAKVKSKPWVEWERVDNKNADFVPGPVDPVVLSHHLWGFLNTNLTSDAYDIFMNVEKSMGFEAWRRVVNGVTKRSVADLLQLEGKVLSPVQVTKESDILMALVRWEGALREYQAAGGETLSEQRRKGGLLRMLPAVHRNKILWEVGDEKGPDEIIEWLRERLRATTSWSGEAPHTVAAVEDEEDVDIEDEMHALQEAGATTEEILAAVVRRFQRRAPQRDARQRGTTRPGAAQPRGPPRNRDDLRCANCLKKGHIAAECKDPKVNKRCCFECEEEGHIAKFCPNKNKKDRAANAITGNKIYAMCMDEEGFVPVQRRRAAPKHPRAAAQRAPTASKKPTLGDFILKNTFKALDTKPEEHPEVQSAERARGASARMPAAVAQVGQAEEERCPIEEFCHGCERISLRAQPQVCAECGMQGAMSGVGDEELSRAAAAELARSPHVEDLTAVLKMPGPNAEQTEKIKYIRTLEDYIASDVKLSEREVDELIASASAHDNHMAPPPPPPPTSTSSLARRARARHNRVHFASTCSCDGCPKGHDKANLEARKTPQVSRDDAAVEMEATGRVATKKVVARRRDALNAQGIVKDNVVSITALPHADDESRAVAEAAEAACGLSLFIKEEEELNYTDEDEFVIIEIALDSGAGDHVAAEVDAPGYSLEESPGSRRGQNFVAAGGHKMPNKGQLTLHLLAHAGDGREEKVSTIFQVADVTRPLWSVSKVCDSGYTVTFNAKTAKVTDANGVVICVFERQGGLYVGRMKLKNPRWSGFSGQGAK